MLNHNSNILLWLSKLMELAERHVLCRETVFISKPKQRPIVVLCTEVVLISEGHIIFTIATILVSLVGNPVQEKAHQLVSAIADGKANALQDILARSSKFELNTLTTLPGDALLSSSSSPLSVAAILTANPTPCQLLIKAGAPDPNHVDAGGRSALHWATLAGHPAIVKTLVGSGAKSDLEDAEVVEKDKNSLSQLIVHTVLIARV